MSANNYQSSNLNEPIEWGNYGWSQNPVSNPKNRCVNQRHNRSTLETARGHEEDGSEFCDDSIHQKSMQSIHQSGKISHEKPTAQLQQIK